MSTEFIDSRYSKLAESSSCLSCGGAIKYANPKSGEVCIDLGSGRGNDVFNMALSVGDNGFVYGQDIATGMVNIANEKANNYGIKNVKFIHSQLETIPLPENSVNLVLSNCVLNHVTNKQQVWSEIFRILVNGGRFVVSDIYSMEPIPEIYATDPTAVAECWAGAITKEEYLTILSNSGFKDIQIFEESKPYEKGKVTVSSFTIKGIKEPKINNKEVVL